MAESLPTEGDQRDERVDGWSSVLMGSAARAG